MLNTASAIDFCFDDLHAMAKTHLLSLLDDLPDSVTSNLMLTGYLLTHIDLDKWPA